MGLKYNNKTISQGKKLFFEIFLQLCMLRYFEFVFSETKVRIIIIFLNKSETYVTNIK